MAYRDDLHALRARIAMLEERLADAADEEKFLVAHNALRAHNAALRDELSALRKQLNDFRGTQPAGRMPTLTEHNRRFPAGSSGRPAGVLCPLCI